MLKFSKIDREATMHKHISFSHHSISNYTSSLYYIIGQILFICCVTIKTEVRFSDSRLKCVIRHASVLILEE